MIARRGEDWTMHMVNTIQKSPYFMICLTPLYLESRLCRAEFRLAVEMKRTIVVVVPPMPEPDQKRALLLNLRNVSLGQYFVFDKDNHAKVMEKLKAKLKPTAYTFETFAAPQVKAKDFVALLRSVSNTDILPTAPFWLVACGNSDGTPAAKFAERLCAFVQQQLSNSVSTKLAICDLDLAENCLRRPDCLGVLMVLGQDPMEEFISGVVAAARRHDKRRFEIVSYTGAHIPSLLDEPNVQAHAPESPTSTLDVHINGFVELDEVATELGGKVDLFCKNSLDQLLPHLLQDRISENVLEAHKVEPVGTEAFPYGTAAVPVGSKGLGSQAPDAAKAPFS